MLTDNLTTRLRISQAGRGPEAVRAGSSYVNELDALSSIGYSGNAQTTPITPAIARAWSEEFPPVTPFKSDWWKS